MENIQTRGESKNLQNFYSGFKISRKKQREMDREIDSQINQMFIQAYQSVMNLKKI